VAQQLLLSGRIGATLTRVRHRLVKGESLAGHPDRQLAVEIP